MLAGHGMGQESDNLGKESIKISRERGKLQKLLKAAC